MAVDKAHTPNGSPLQCHVIVVRLEGCLNQPCSYLHSNRNFCLIRKCWRVTILWPWNVMVSTLTANSQFHGTRHFRVRCRWSVPKLRWPHSEINANKSASHSVGQPVSVSVSVSVLVWVSSLVHSNGDVIACGS